MRSLFVSLVLVSLCASVQAGTLRNRDFREYHLSLQFPDGRMTEVIVSGGATLDGFCAYDGCFVTLLETRDSAGVGPNDDVEIFYGRLRVRPSFFQ